MSHGLKSKNLHITGWNLNYIFTGGKPELAQITEDKDINPKKKA